MQTPTPRDDGSKKRNEVVCESFQTPNQFNKKRQNFDSTELLRKNNSTQNILQDAINDVNDNLEYNHSDVQGFQLKVNMKSEK